MPRKRKPRKPKLGNLVRVEWVDIVSGSMTPKEGLADAWAIGIVTEWDRPDEHGINRTVLESGGWYDKEHDIKRDKTVLPHAVITTWKIYL